MKRSLAAKVASIPKPIAPETLKSIENISLLKKNNVIQSDYFKNFSTSKYFHKMNREDLIASKCKSSKKRLRECSNRSVEYSSIISSDDVSRKKLKMEPKTNHNIEFEMLDYDEFIENLKKNIEKNHPTTSGIENKIPIRKKKSIFTDESQKLMENFRESMKNKPKYSQQLNVSQISCSKNNTNVESANNLDQLDPESKIPQLETFKNELNNIIPSDCDSDNESTSSDDFKEETSIVSNSEAAKSPAFCFSIPMKNEDGSDELVYLTPPPLEYDTAEETEETDGLFGLSPSTLD